MDVVRTPAFEKSWKKLGASVADLAKLEAEIARNPDAGDLIVGLHGARKIRFSMKGRGKSGGGRAIYLVIWKDDVSFLLLAYSKSDQSDLANDQRQMLKAAIKELKDG